MVIVIGIGFLSNMGVYATPDGSFDVPDINGDYDTGKDIPNPQPTPRITYNRDQVIEYMRKYIDSNNPENKLVNPKYERFDDSSLFFSEGGDCSNFVSQTLHESGLPMNDDWYYKKTKKPWWKFWGDDSEYSTKWTVADENYKYFSDLNNGFAEENIEISSLDNLDQTYQSGKVKKGDLLYWDFQGDGKIDHATMITEIDGELKYSGHTSDKFNSKLRYEYEFLKKDKKYKNAKLHVVRMKDQVQ